ncbi:right-handed parallel beta-helix repeat-containing protein [Chryseobacterium rhizosphaerae]|uniref:Right handed beta helix domain-containing protein n=1 Tax=Chryseobacterium rhizosphaerae TaxID=395937 RepID=A0ABX9IQI2_9FLAO|nr:right-handed parallel beta-helix repeat-containing protein [Chryseobacterium rhizosphaerae]MDC8102321.1 right-handed parallel beta-helix repeat-containing protein [Chryseobacterium rhizosphaerae]REC78393.1 hypothetical protein DRF57_02875 [Chryseobacterium rhizosphaerae]GEN66686.1 hypothetical protein CRH01_12540 [Chryseobacterium rhizosphaerae]
MNQFLIKDSMVDMRNMSTNEITDIQNGIYKGVLLLGYYKKGDTPAPIAYYSYLGNDNIDDGGSLIILNGLKLFHEFLGEVDVRYFGAKSQVNLNQSIIINNALYKCRNIIIDDMYYISAENNDSGVMPPSNTSIKFTKKGCFKAIASTSESYRILKIYNALNVTIINPFILGERDEHAGTTGEWGHGISITNSRDILIENPNIKNCWGDGIYIGNEYWNHDSIISTENVIINNALIDNVRRNGISITSNKNITINNPKIRNVNGALPQSGIDIEPEGIDGLPIVIDNINIINPLTENNMGAGIMLFVSNYLLLENNPQINININNHIDLGSLHGFFIPSFRDGLEGCINITNPKYSNNKSGAILISNYAKEYAPLLILDAPVIKNWNTSKNQFYYYKHAIGIIKEDEDNEYRNTNILIKNPTFDYTDIGDITTSIFQCHSANPNKKSIILKNVRNINGGNNVMGIVKGVVIIDMMNLIKGNYWETDSTINFIRTGSFLTTYTNSNLADNPLFRIQGNLWTDGQRISFLVEKQGSLITIVSDSNNIYPPVIGGNLSSRDVGNKITLEFNNGNWYIVEKLGIWTNAQGTTNSIISSNTEPINMPENSIWIDIYNNQIKKKNITGNWDLL